jgi:predicted regulator of Ras-like GTPase activity (Roadblock/LC7/MglB family)
MASSSGGSSQEVPAERLRLDVRADLEALVRRSPALRFACVGTADGRLFAQVGRDGAVGGERIAAMTSSMLALGESFAKDALRGRCEYSIVSTQVGSIVVVRVPHRARGYMLSVGSDGSEVLASTLRAALDSAERIAAIIGGAVA